MTYIVYSDDGSTKGPLQVGHHELKVKQVSRIGGISSAMFFHRCM